MGRWVRFPIDCRDAKEEAGGWGRDGGSETTAQDRVRGLVQVGERVFAQRRCPAPCGGPSKSLFFPSLVFPYLSKRSQCEWPGSGRARGGDSERMSTDTCVGSQAKHRWGSEAMAKQAPQGCSHHGL